MTKTNRARIVALAAAAFGVAASTACGSSEKKPAASANEVSSGSATTGSEPKEKPMREASCGNHP